MTSEHFTFNKNVAFLVFYNWNYNL